MVKEINFIEQIMAKLLQEKRLQEGKILTFEEHLKDKAWITDINYLKYEIGVSKIKISEINYIYSLIEKRLNFLKEKIKKNDLYMQQKMM